MMDGVLVGKDASEGRNMDSPMNSIFLACQHVFRSEPALLNLQAAGTVVGGLTKLLIEPSVMPTAAPDCSGVSRLASGSLAQLLRGPMNQLTLKVVM
ncbi:MAG TPA: hypothetical protein DEF45_19915 [Rhodopirellula sp.]|nr:hypothetical protein [Rhodopirellula sp.]